MERIIKLCLSSDNRINITTTSTTDFSFILNANINERIKAFRIVSVQMPFKFYPVNSNNNLIWFQENIGGLVSATIPPGSYSTATLITAIQTAMSAVSPNARSYVVTYDSTLDRFVFTISAGTFAFLFGSNLTRSAAVILGFSNDNTQLVTQNSSNGPIISGYPALFLRSDFLSGSLPRQYVQNLNISNVVATLPINVNFNNLIMYYDQTDQFYDIDLKSLNKIDFKITGTDGSIIDNRGGGVYIELEIKY